MLNPIYYVSRTICMVLYHIQDNNSMREGKKTSSTDWDMITCTTIARINSSGLLALGAH